MTAAAMPPIVRKFSEKLAAAVEGDSRITLVCPEFPRGEGGVQPPNSKNTEEGLALRSTMEPGEV
jgi:hypothetical protein